MEGYKICFHIKIVWISIRILNEVERLVGGGGYVVDGSSGGCGTEEIIIVIDWIY